MTSAFELPPETLYYGTVDTALPHIRAHGIEKTKQQDVQLVADVDVLTQRSRRGTPVILTVRAAAMADAGHVLQRADDGVWQTEHVPPKFIMFKGPKGSGQSTRGAKVGSAKVTLRTCDDGAYTNEDGERIEIAAALAAAKAGTVLHELGEELAPPVARSMTISVTGESTVDAVRRLGGHVGCLNFASAKNPGGGFLGGAQAQEEAIARASALYPCLLTQPAHYERNRANHSALYLDLAIFSPLVPFFRDDHGEFLPRPMLASVITCAAPNASALRQQGKHDPRRIEVAFRRRASFVLAIAAHHGIERLVLGAWGAGVFGNDPVMVADAFAVPLAGPFAGAFDEVVFAIHGRPENQRAFASAFPS